MADSVVTVQNFRKVYGKLVAVDDVSFQVPAGQIFGLLGPNGAGKTSTLECLEGLRTPDGGTLSIGGIDPVHQSRLLRNVIGVQLQTSGLPATISVEEAMKLFCAYHQVAPRYDLLDRLNLAEKRSAQYQELSAGQQRRLALALAVAHHPRILFLDEPTAGLDVASRVALHDLMHQLQAEGTTIILATHDMAEAEAMADYITILLRGKIAAQGTPLEITASGGKLSKVTVRTEGGCLARRETAFPAITTHLVKDEYIIYYSTDIGSTVSAIIAYIEAQSDKLVDLRIERPSLEDRFLEITNP
jgi:ABC-2 type transport system ATP-binding protein